jgi:DNA-binding HxlR family transcriptional regulator
VEDRNLPGIDLHRLIEVTRKGWALPVLAKLGEGVKPRLAPLASALEGASRASLLEGIEHLVHTGLVLRNTGHGHPLRPELVLTDEGRAIARRAARMWTVAGELGLQAQVRRRWCLPLACALDGPLTYTQIRERLGPVTDRALSAALKEGMAAGLTERLVLADRFPPATLYRPLPRGLQLAATLA